MKECFPQDQRKPESPLEAADHLELNTTEFCDEKEIKYQTLIGQLQCLISLGRFDINAHASTLSYGRAQPRKCHLSGAKRIFGYLEWEKMGLSGSEWGNLITLISRAKNLTGLGLSMVMWRKLNHMSSQTLKKNNRNLVITRLLGLVLVISVAQCD